MTRTASTRLTDPDLSKRFCFRQPVGIDVKGIALQTGTTVNGLLRIALLEYLEKNNLAS
ncbi:MAG: hypothetical protein ACYTXE_35085 [Nostoc sp.]